VLVSTRKYARITCTFDIYHSGSGGRGRCFFSSNTFCYLNDILIILKAEVSAPANAEEANRPDYVLNKYDYFGYGKTFPVMIIWFNSVQTHSA
jgi:hypothetical protein